MRRIVLVVLGVLTASTGAFAQTAAETIERAAVITWNADGTAAATPPR